MKRVNASNGSNRSRLLGRRYSSKADWRVGGCEIVRGVPAEEVSGVPQEGVLPHVDPREPAATGEEGTGEARLGQRTRVGQAGTAGLTAFRLCNLVAQSRRTAEGGFSAG